MNTEKYVYLEISHMRQHEVLLGTILKYKY